METGEIERPVELWAQISAQLTILAYPRGYPPSLLRQVSTPLLNLIKNHARYRLRLRLDVTQGRAVSNNMRANGLLIRKKAIAVGFKNTKERFPEPQMQEDGSCTIPVVTRAQS